MEVDQTFSQLSYLDLVPEDHFMGTEHIHCLFKRPIKQIKIKSEERSIRDKKN